ncbi:MAG: Mrp/NBP35 family ATP-binding protein [Alphaproteobacteria bacterium]
MQSEITSEKVKSALRQLKFIHSKDNIVDDGDVSGIVIKDGHIGFSIEIDPALANQSDELRRKAEDVVSSLSGVLSATAILTAHKAASTSEPPPRSKPEASRNPPLKPAKHVIAVASGKGGVGKSTTAINIALALKQMGLLVGILDADIYGPSLPRLLGTSRKPEYYEKKLVPLDVWGLQTMSIGFLVEPESPTIWRGPMVMSAIEQMLRDVLWTDLDVLVIDLPPGTGDAQLTLCQRASLSGAVIVSTPQDLALIDARKGLNMFRKVDVPILGIIENMSYFICPDCDSRHDIFSTGGAEKEAAKLDVAFLGGIPLDMTIRQTSDAGEPIVATQPENPHSKAYSSIAQKIWDSLEGQNAEGPATIPAIIIE